MSVSNYYVGLTATTSDFYARQSRSTTAWDCPSHVEDLLPVLQKAEVLNFEMETATLHFGGPLWAKSMFNMAVYANRCTNEFKPGVGEENVIKIANEATRILYGWDKKKRKAGKRWLFPSVLNAG